MLIGCINGVNPCNNTIIKLVVSIISILDNKSCICQRLVIAILFRYCELSIVNFCLRRLTCELAIITIRDCSSVLSCIYCKSITSNCCLICNCDLAVLCETLNSIIFECNCNILARYFKSIICICSHACNSKAICHISKSCSHSILEYIALLTFTNSDFSLVIYYCSNLCKGFLTIFIHGRSTRDGLIHARNNVLIFNLRTRISGIDRNNCTCSCCDVVVTIRKVFSYCSSATG